MYLLTKWEGQMGKYLARGREVGTKRRSDRAKIFPVRPDLTWSIGMLSHDHFVFLICTSSSVRSVDFLPVLSE